VIENLSPATLSQQTMCSIMDSNLLPIQPTLSTSLANIYNSSSKDEMISITPSLPAFSQEQPQMQSRRVSFSEHEFVDTVTQSSAIQLEDKQSSTWYLPQELHIFKMEVRLSTQAIRNKGISSGNNATATMYNTVDYPTRGLEQRICKNRQRNKALAIWGTLKAQQRNNDPEFIAMIARKCSHSATQLAYMEAARDYCEIYNPEEVSSLSAQIERFASQSFPIKLKRKTPESASSSTSGNRGTKTNERNVRIRLN